MTFVKHQCKEPDRSIINILLGAILIGTFILGTACQGGTPPNVEPVPTVPVPTVKLIPTVEVPSLAPVNTPAQTPTANTKVAKSTAEMSNPRQTSTTSRANTPRSTENGTTPETVERTREGNQPSNHQEALDDAYHRYYLAMPDDELISATIDCLEQDLELWEFIRTSNDAEEVWVSPEDAREGFHWLVEYPGRQTAREYLAATAFVCGRVNDIAAGKIKTIPELLEAYSRPYRELPIDELVSVAIGCLEQDPSLWKAVRTTHEEQFSRITWESPGDARRQFTDETYEMRDALAAIAQGCDSGDFGSTHRTMGSTYRAQIIACRLVSTNTDQYNSRPPTEQCLRICDNFLQQQLMASPLVAANASNTNAVIMGIQAQFGYCPAAMWNPEISDTGGSTDSFATQIPLSLSRVGTYPTKNAPFKESPVQDESGNIGLDFVATGSRHSANGFNVTLPADQSTRWMYIASSGVWYAAK